jgi:hypothetical protein
MMDAQEALNIPIREMDLGDSFCSACNQMGFETLADIVLILPEELIKRKGFSYTWLGQISGYLDSKGLLYLLQPLPGRNRV